MKNLHKIPLVIWLIALLIPTVLMGLALPRPASADIFPTQAQLDLGLKPLDYEAALERAKADNKIALLYFWAEWCGNCQNFSDYVLTDPKIIEALNKDFVFVSIDIDKDKPITESYRVRAVPTSIFLESDSKPVSILPGAVPGQVFAMILDYMAGGSYKDMEFAQYFEEKHGGDLGLSAQETGPGKPRKAPSAPQDGPLLAQLSDYLRGLYLAANTPGGARLAWGLAHVSLRGLTTHSYWAGAPILVEKVLAGEANQWPSLSKSDLLGEVLPLEPKAN